MSESYIPLYQTPDIYSSELGPPNIEITGHTLLKVKPRIEESNVYSEAIIPLFKEEY